jgi:NAD(P) transhydrogenase subunit beta
MGAGIWTLILIAIFAGFIGWHLIMGIGGADMPVVVSMLNSYSGWAAAAIGFTLGNDLLIVTGALVGSSGAILSYIMCKAMNRSFISVILGGFGGPQAAMQIEGEQVAIDADGVAAAERRRQRHHRAGLRHGGGAGAAIGLRTDAQAARGGKDVRFAIHPVAGRLPGHMNVLWPKPRCPTTSCWRWTRSTRTSPTDVVIVIGSNDIVNPAAQEDPAARSPACRCWRSGRRRTSSSQARPGHRLFRHREPAVLQGEHAHVLRRRQEVHRPTAADDRLIVSIVRERAKCLNQKSAGRGENGGFRAPERSVHDVREHRSAEKHHLQPGLTTFGSDTKAYRV